MIYIKFFENYKNIDFDDLWIEFGYYNQYLIEKLTKKEFKNLVNKSPKSKLSYKEVPKIYQRYNKDFEELKSIKDDKKIEWWLPKYLKSRKFEPKKQSKEYFYGLIEAIKNDRVDEPIFILNINNHKFICGGRNRATLSYIIKKDIDCITINITKQNKEVIKDIIDNLNK